MGLTTTQSVSYDAQLAAAVKLNAALDAAASAAASDKAYADFNTDADAALMAMDSSGKKATPAPRSCASVAFRASVKARLMAGGQMDPVADASLYAPRRRSRKSRRQRGGIDPRRRLGRFGEHDGGSQCGRPC